MRKPLTRPQSLEQPQARLEQRMRKSSLAQEQAMADMVSLGDHHPLAPPRKTARGLPSM